MQVASTAMNGAGWTIAVIGILIALASAIPLGAGEPQRSP